MTHNHNYRTLFSVQRCQSYKWFKMTKKTSKYKFKNRFLSLCFSINVFVWSKFFIILIINNNNCCCCCCCCYPYCTEQFWWKQIANQLTANEVIVTLKNSRSLKFFDWTNRLSTKNKANKIQNFATNYWLLFNKNTDQKKPIKPELRQY